MGERAPENAFGKCHLKNACAMLHNTKTKRTTNKWMNKNGVFYFYPAHLLLGRGVARFSKGGEIFFGRFQKSTDKIEKQVLKKTAFKKKGFMWRVLRKKSFFFFDPPKN